MDTKKEYAEPTTEVIRYNDIDIILTSTVPRHHCGIGSASGHNYVDDDGDGHCDNNYFDCQTQYGNDEVNHSTCNPDCDSDEDCEEYEPGT